MNSIASAEVTRALAPKRNADLWHLNFFNANFSNLAFGSVGDASKRTRNNSTLSFPRPRPVIWSAPRNLSTSLETLIDLGTVCNPSRYPDNKLCSRPEGEYLPGDRSLSLFHSAGGQKHLCARMKREVPSLRQRAEHSPPGFPRQSQINVVISLGNSLKMAAESSILRYALLGAADDIQVTIVPCQ